MAKLDIAKLKETLKQEDFSRLFLIYGNEHYLINHAVNMIKEFTAKNDGDFLQLDGSKTTAEAFTNSIESVPMFGGFRAVMLNTPPIPQGDNAGELIEEVIKAAEDMPPHTLFLLVIKDNSFSPSKNKACKMINAAFEKNGNILKFEKQQPADLTAFITRTLKKSGKNIEKNVASELIRHCGTDMSILNNELSKLSAIGSDNITNEDIHRYTVETVEARVFDLTNAINAKNPSQAMRILSDLLYLKEPPTMIMAVLSNSFCDLYRAKVAQASNVALSTASEDFGFTSKNNFRLKNAYNQSAKHTASKLYEALALLTDADLSLKSSKVNDRIILEKAVISLISLLHDSKK